MRVTQHFVCSSRKCAVEVAVYKRVMHNYVGALQLECFFVCNSDVCIDSAGLLSVYSMITYTYFRYIYFSRLAKLNLFALQSTILSLCFSYGTIV